ncbi:CHAT domain-containing protein [Thermocoleostomius sinensis]|uniref:CHAT domain-containing protein n=1 Tax=Thermocoleostomius sinensis A174 TaxID=2016057 RepID=A0A9E8ZAH3_9CYAN|nr:CHAT domain-containing protein [Thermocoleostomius sinensis]WAL59575.1 CHAT domain-containing protein [Thermocoleostomius sinensis A174]
MKDIITPKSILLLAANPRETRSLRLQEEEREIRERLRLAGYGKTPINSTGATRSRDIQQAMLDFKPQIVHFSGHGAAQEGLVFEDAAGQGKLVNSSALANLFRLFNRVECVVLNACYSKFQAEAIARHIEYVIGMSQRIGDKAAIEFSVGFYSALGSGESIEFAYELGCNAIQLEGLPEELTPVLYKKGKLLQIYIGNRVLRTDEANDEASRELHQDRVEKNLGVNTVPSEHVSEHSTQTILEVQKSPNKDAIILNILSKLFDALSSPNREIGIRKFEEIAHQSLFQNGQIDPAFRKNCFDVAATRLNLYKQPAEVTRSEITSRTRLGLRGDKEEGREEKYVIARKEQLGGFKGHVRIFFPANGSSAKVSGLNL